MSDWLKERVKEEHRKQRGLTPELIRLLRMGQMRADQRNKNLRNGGEFRYLSVEQQENQQAWLAMAEHAAR